MPKYTPKYTPTEIQKKYEKYTKLGGFHMFFVFFLYFGFGGGFGVYLWHSEGFCILYGGRMIATLDPAFLLSFDRTASTTTRGPSGALIMTLCLLASIFRCARRLVGSKPVASTYHGDGSEKGIPP